MGPEKSSLSEKVKMNKLVLETNYFLVCSKIKIKHPKIEYVCSVNGAIVGVIQVLH